MAAPVHERRTNSAVPKSAAAPAAGGGWWGTLVSIRQVIAVAGAAVYAVASAFAPSCQAASAETTAAAPPANPIEHAENLRSEAHALKVDRDRHWKDSQDCYARGDGAGAALASGQRKATQTRIEQLRAHAAKVLFQHHNQGCGLGEIDLHGLYVEEALAQLTRRIEACEQRLRSPASSSSGPPVLRLVVIVGRGNHSRDKVAKLRPAVEELIRTHRLRVHADTPNSGCLTIEFQSKEPSGWVGRVTDACAIM